MILDSQSTPSSEQGLGTVRIKVVGVGGAGVNALRRMASSPIPGVELLCINTDATSLESVSGIDSIVLGASCTRGLGAGGNPEVGKRAAEEAADEVRRQFHGVDLVFIAAGMGGGTGTGASPVIASLAREMGAVTVGVVTTPFKFEGSKRKLTALKGLLPLREQIDTLILVDNQRLSAVVDKNTSMRDAFVLADRAVTQAILSVARIINIPGEVNVDFADVRAVVRDGGMGLMGIARGEGERRLINAAKTALANPLVDIKPEGAKSVLFFIDAGPDLTLSEVTDAGSYITSIAAPDAQIYFGLRTDPQRREGHEVEVMIIATHLASDGNADGIVGALDQLRATVPIYSSQGELPPFFRMN